MANFIRHVPNILTFLRLGVIPIFVVLMINPSQSMIYVALGIFIFAALTDYVDGLVARKWEVVSDFGKLLDPLADKILVMAALVMLVAQRTDVLGEPWVPGWIVVVILAREIWVTGVRGFAAHKGVIVAAGQSGKLKSVLQMGAIAFLILHHHAFEVGGLTITCGLIGMNLLLISIVFSYVSAVEYTYQVMWVSDGAPTPKSRKS
ncbi:CDP-diacylglycerol--glycerol-3-phosphate 3-phosphatidyltransferase [Oligoflexia bacterium]|nr:CDP-diacylglycerol--glycerol-3-phosphate 3-phosphatidyltransferase [Oligoflexia bacterium]